MNLTYFLLKDHLPRLNEYDYTKNDIYRIYSRDRVRYAERDIDGEGCYEVDENGQEYIVVNVNLTDTEKLRTNCHETVHHFMDFPISDEAIKLNRHLKTLQTRKDLNAEVLSLIMMFSLVTLKRYQETGDLPYHLQPYLEERLQINKDYEI